MYYQNLNVIHEPSKKLLIMKSVKKKINTLYMQVCMLQSAAKKYKNGAYISLLSARKRKRTTVIQPL